MLSIDMRRRGAGSERLFDEFCLVIDGEPIVDSWALRSGNKFHAGVFDLKTVRDLSDRSFIELGQVFSELHLSLESAPYDWIDDVKIVWSEDGQPSHLDFRFNIIAEHWANPWSVAQFAEGLRRVVEEAGIEGVEYIQEDEIVLNDLALRFRNIASESVSEEVSRCACLAASLCEEAESVVASAVRQDALVALFTFPSEIRVACEQYLVYFVQFLEDLGIPAKSDLQERARGVLFTVTPASGAEALGRVRVALDAHLQLPTEPAFAAVAGLHHDVASQQLAANVYHLQSQLALARAMIQSKNVTIELLQVSNLQYRRLMMGSTGSPYNLPGDGQREEILGGAVTITTYEGKGFELNLPLLFRKLRRLLKP